METLDVRLALSAQGAIDPLGGQFLAPPPALPGPDFTFADPRSFGGGPQNASGRGDDHDSSLRLDAYDANSSTTTGTLYDGRSSVTSQQDISVSGNSSKNWNDPVSQTTWYVVPAMPTGYVLVAVVTTPSSNWGYPSGILAPPPSNPAGGSRDNNVGSLGQSLPKGSLGGGYEISSLPPTMSGPTGENDPSERQSYNSAAQGRLPVVPPSYVARLTGLATEIWTYSTPLATLDARRELALPSAQQPAQRHENHVQSSPDRDGGLIELDSPLPTQQRTPSDRGTAARLALPKRLSDADDESAAPSEIWSAWERELADWSGRLERERVARDREAQPEGNPSAAARRHLADAEGGLIELDASSPAGVQSGRPASLKNPGWIAGSVEIDAVMAMVQQFDLAGETVGEVAPAAQEAAAARDEALPADTQEAAADDADTGENKRAAAVPALGVVAAGAVAMLRRRREQANSAKRHQAE